MHTLTIDFATPHSGRSLLLCASKCRSPCGKLERENQDLRQGGKQKATHQTTQHRSTAVLIHRCKHLQLHNPCSCYDLRAAAHHAYCTHTNRHTHTRVYVKKDTLRAESKVNNVITFGCRLTGGPHSRPFPAGEGEQHKHLIKYKCTFCSKLVCVRVFVCVCVFEAIGGLKSARLFQRSTPTDPLPTYQTVAG